MASLPETLTTPVLIDPHVHLREPGSNHSENISSGTRAALLGGYALIGDMPNNPGHPTWTEERLLEKHILGANDSYIPVTFHSGSQPESDNIGELEAMSKLSLWLKLYGAPTTGNHNDYEAADFLDIVREWHRVAPDKPIGLHAGRDNLEDMIGLVAQDFGHQLHIHHVSSSKEIQAVKRARERGLDVSCGVCPHHLLKTAHDVWTEGWFARMQPPLASQTEAEKLMYHLAQGDIDIVETDHAPHSIDSKLKAETDNPFGIHDSEHTTCFGVPGIEFAAPLMFYQARRGRISMERVVVAMSYRPAALLGVRLRPDSFANWQMVEYRIGEDDRSESLAGWTPYLGKLALGYVTELHTSGRTLIEDCSVSWGYPAIITERGSEI